MNIKDFEEFAGIIKDNYDITKYLLRNHITEEDIKKLNKDELVEKMYNKEVEIQREEVQSYINQIKLLYEVYKRLKKFTYRKVEIYPFYYFLKSIEEYDGLIEDIIECSAPKYIEDLHVHCNNEKRWVDFICQDNFNLEDLENGKIKFNNSNNLKLFNHVGKGVFKLIFESETDLDELEDYNLRYISDYLEGEINSQHDNLLLESELDCIVMINNQAIYRFEKREESCYCDCIESDFMYHFILWYRKEYQDKEFNGSNVYTRVWGYLDYEK
jgi:hypothetical protein